MKRFRLVIFFALFVVFGGFAVAFYVNREPRYQGLTLTEWIKKGARAKQKLFNRSPHPLFLYSPSDNDSDWQAASHAVKQMAPDAIPVLLKWAHAEDSPAVDTVKEWLNQHADFRFGASPSLRRNLKAELGFELLGNEAKPAWPILHERTFAGRAQRRDTAFVCLAMSGPPKDTIMPVFLQLMHDPDEIRFRAAWLFHELYPQEAEAAGLYKTFPQLKDEPTYYSPTNQTRTNR